MGLARGVHSATSRFLSAMATWNFGGQPMVSTSVPSFVRMTLTKRDFACSMPFRLQTLRCKQRKPDRNTLFRSPISPGLHCWRHAQAGAGPDATAITQQSQLSEANRISELQLENSRLRRLVTDLLLEKMTLEETVKGQKLERGRGGAR